MRSITVFAVVVLGMFTAVTRAAEPARPGILILRFAMLGEEAKHAWIGQAIQQDLQAEFARDSAYQVLASPKGVAQAATEAEAPDARDALRVGKEMGAAVVVFGSYQVVEGEVRVTGQILDVASGQSAGGLKASGDLRQLLKLEDAIAEQALHVAGPEEPAVAQADPGAPQREVQFEDEEAEAPPEEAANLPPLSDYEPVYNPYTAYSPSYAPSWYYPTYYSGYYPGYIYEGPHFYAGFSTCYPRWYGYRYRPFLYPGPYVYPGYYPGYAYYPYPAYYYPTYYYPSFGFSIGFGYYDWPGTWFGFGYHHYSSWRGHDYDHRGPRFREHWRSDYHTRYADLRGPRRELDPRGSHVQRVSTASGTRVADLRGPRREYDPKLGMGRSNRTTVARNGGKSGMDMLPHAGTSRDGRLIAPLGRRTAVADASRKSSGDSGTKVLTLRRDAKPITIDPKARRSELNDSTARRSTLNRDDAVVRRRSTDDRVIVRPKVEDRPARSYTPESRVQPLRSRTNTAERSRGDDRPRISRSEERPVFRAPAESRRSEAAPRFESRRSEAAPRMESPRMESPRMESRRADPPAARSDGGSRSRDDSRGGGGGGGGGGGRSGGGGGGGGGRR